jgi:hypothetical protein
MLLNPARERPAVIPGTRILESTLGIIGGRVSDPSNPLRVWEVQSIFSPIPGRALGGVRIKVEDQKGFVSFCNQRDFEVLLGMGIPGRLCPWLDRAYVSWEDSEWCGFCCDEEDLRDDLYDRELGLRGWLEEMHNQQFIMPGYDIDRKVHLDKNIDVAELFVLIADLDPETGTHADRRFHTVERRWMRAERTPVRWEKM